MDKRYAFLFPINGSIQWSGESAEYIRNTRFERASDEALAELAEFFESCESGDFITLPCWGDGSKENVAILCERA
jgi:hypothetical protein